MADFYPTEPFPAVLKVCQPLLPGSGISPSKYHQKGFAPNLANTAKTITNMQFSFLQIVPIVSNTQGRPTVAYPLIIVIVASALKDLFEDRKRHY